MFYLRCGVKLGVLNIQITSAIKMTGERDISLTSLCREDITPEIISLAALFFSENYGVWKDGSRVKMSPARLERMILPNGGRNQCVRATRDGKLVGHVFACHWNHKGRRICWVAQLVVDQQSRRQGIAISMLRKLREEEQIHIVGILSSHPGAIRAALRAFGRGLEDVDLETTRSSGVEIMASYPVGYVKTARVHGSLFDDKVNDGSVSSAYTGFHVDHAEPVEALEQVQKEGHVWPFGELPEGNEFLVLLEVSS
jgi:hypothetical protein